MKALDNIRNTFLVSCLALGAFAVLTPDLALAAGKGASKLMFNSSDSQGQVYTASAKVATTSCARCVEGSKQVADTSAKGMRAGSQKTVPVHMCPSCQTRILSTGSGKAKTDKVVHSCGNDSSSAASCCMAAR